jgi:hypothetical protein
MHRDTARATDRRFAAARVTPGYVQALADIPERPAITAAIARALLLTVALAGPGWLICFADARGGCNWASSIVAIAIAVVVLGELRALCVPVRAELAMIVGSWSGLVGSSPDGQRVERSLTLRFANGAERECAAPGALSVQNAGDIGVAYLRGGMLVGFHPLAV